jgi:hypothetical protein
MKSIVLLAVFSVYGRYIYWIFGIFFVSVVVFVWLSTEIDKLKTLFHWRRPFAWLTSALKFAL